MKIDRRIYTLLLGVDNGNKSHYNGGLELYIARSKC